MYLTKRTETNVHGVTTYSATAGFSSPLVARAVAEELDGNAIHFKLADGTISLTAQYEAAFSQAMEALERAARTVEAQNVGLVAILRTTIEKMAERFSERTQRHEDKLQELVQKVNQLTQEVDHMVRNVSGDVVNTGAQLQDLARRLDAIEAENRILRSRIVDLEQQIARQQTLEQVPANGNNHSRDLLSWIRR